MIYLCITNILYKVLKELKADKGMIRICGDFQMTINPALHSDPYPIPRMEDLLSTLAGQNVI